ncbi:MAG: 3-phosphoshikimate 1-carboxyvinyltransferase [Clostridia bacterium]|nr:3-phosphoshikimate 1-carboxyvinyltransferase [Clostridia bacterium]
MTKYIEKNRAEGEINAPTSKSVAHRLLIAAAMCGGKTSVIDGITPCEDVLATIDCLRALGAKINYSGERAEVDGIDFRIAKPSDTLNCRESGSTLRFLIPLCLLSGNDVTLTGSEKLISRPQTVYEEIAERENFYFKKESDRISLSGSLSAGEYYLPGNVSSQFITGLLFALSTLEGDSKIIITTKLESRSYVDLTIQAMAEFGVNVCWDSDSVLLIRGGQEYSARTITVEGDYSGAAFIDAFNHLGGRVLIHGLNEKSLQGDRVYREHFDALDSGFATIDIEDCPDLGPILFAMAAVKSGGHFTGTKRLKIKESDRAEAMRQELYKFGCELVIEGNSVTVKKCELHAPTEKLCGHNDHRIVMSLAVILTLFGGEIEGCEAVSKSYPDFFLDIKKLGISTYEI